MARREIPPFLSTVIVPLKVLAVLSPLTLRQRFYDGQYLQLPDEYKLEFRVTTPKMALV